MSDKTRIIIMLPPEILKDLEDICKYYGVDKSSAIRIAIRRWRNNLKEI